MSYVFKYFFLDSILIFEIECCVEWPVFQENYCGGVIFERWLGILAYYRLCGFESDLKGEDPTIGMILYWFMANDFLRLIV